MTTPTRESHWFDREIQEVATAHGLDPRLVEAVVLVESSGFSHAYRFEPEFWANYMADKPEWKGANPRRVSASYGLMQVLFTTARARGYEGEPEGLFAPHVSLEFGCRELTRLLEWANGQVDQALAAYNGGQGNWRAPKPQAYVKKVRKAMPELHA